MAEQTDFDLRLAAKKAMMPDEGFNVVGMDDYEDPGEELYFVAHASTMEQAQAFVAERKKENPDEVLYIYGQKGA